MKPSNHYKTQSHRNIDSKPKNANTILNGLKIFKLNDSDGSFFGLNQFQVTTPSNAT